MPNESGAEVAILCASSNKALVCLGIGSLARILFVASFDSSSNLDPNSTTNQKRRRMKKSDLFSDANETHSRKARANINLKINKRST